MGILHAVATSIPHSLHSLVQPYADVWGVPVKVDNSTTEHCGSYGHLGAEGVLHGVKEKTWNRPVGSDQDTDSQDLSLQGLWVDGFPGALQQLPQSVYPHVRAPNQNLIRLLQRLTRNAITSLYLTGLHTHCRE